MDLEEKIKSYKKHLDSSPSDSRAKHILERLKSFDITLPLLLSTGIGRAVNKYRKHATLAKDAKHLVKKWQKLAAIPPEDEVPPEKKKKSYKHSNNKHRSTERNADLNSSESIETDTERPISLNFEEHKKTCFSELSAAKIPTASLDWSKVLPDVKPGAYRSLNTRPAEEASTYRNGLHKRSTVDAQAMPSSMFTARKEKTSMFAGRKKTGLEKVPTLFEAAMRVICDNIDAIEDTGDIPFDILRPALERATPAQLFYIEENNPYLIEDTNELWEKHCHRDFRGEKPDMESAENWRELYQRKLYEQKEKLKKVTASISAHQKQQSAPVKKTQLADVVTPREVRRRQAKYGTAPKAIPTTQEIIQVKRAIKDTGSSAERAQLHLKQSAIYRPGDPLAMMSAPKRSGGGGSRHGGGPSKAPMMAKALKMMGRRKK